MTQRNPWLITAVIALVALSVGAGGGILIYNAVVGGSAEPSAEITAPTLDVNAVPTQSVNQLSTQVAQLQAEATDSAAAAAAAQEAIATLEAENAALGEQLAEAALAAAAEAVTEAPTATLAPTVIITPTAVPPTEVPTEAPTQAPAEAAAESATRSLYRINPENSRVSFFIDETLSGNRITVEGTTNQVAGDIVVDFAAPSTSQVGTIRINARTLATDNEFRNQALRARILQSSQDQYEFIEFVPTELLGLPGSVNVGQEITFQIVGDLTIRGATRTVTFEVTVTPISEAQLEGLARTTVLYRDFNLAIPSVPNVSDISDEVILEIAFVADLVEG